MSSTKCLGMIKTGAIFFLSYTSQQLQNGQVCNFLVQETIGFVKSISIENGYHTDTHVDIQCLINDSTN